MTIPEIMQELGKLRSETESAYESYKIKKMELDSIKTLLKEELEAIGLKSAKTDEYTASIVQKPSIIVTHEESVIDWLENNPDVEPDLYIGLKKSSFDPLAKAWFAKTGEVIPGTDTQVSEYISIKNNKKEK